MSLKRAREKRDEARSLVADGIDPAAKKKADRLASADTFAAIAAEYLELRREHLNPRTLAKAEWILNDWLLKYLGSQPLNTIKPVDILSVCRRLESRGKRETAHRTRALAGRIMRYAVCGIRLRPAAWSAIRLLIYAVRSPRSASSTTPRSQIRSRLANSYA